MDTPRLSRTSATPLILALSMSFGVVSAPAQTPSPTTTTYIVPYSLGETTFEGRYIVPNPTPTGLPLIVLFPDWMGITPHAKQDAGRLVERGYAVFVADLYGKQAQPGNPREAARVSGALKQDVVKLRKIAAAALKTARHQYTVDTNRVGAVGFCFGGNAALELARSGAPLDGIAVVHGNLKTPFPDDARAIRGRVLVLHGSADPHVPPSEVSTFRDEMNRAEADFTLIEYPGAMHAFTNPAAQDSAGGVRYDPVAAEAAFNEMERFFADVLEKD